MTRQYEYAETNSKTDLNIACQIALKWIKMSFGWQIMFQMSNQTYPEFNRDKYRYEESHFLYGR